MRHTLCLLLLFCSSLTPLPAEKGWTAESDKLTIQPEVLDIGTFYAGGQVKISGEVPQGQDVIVEIAGPAANGQFDLKGRVGPFWMTNGRAEMDGAPAMYVLLLPGGQEWQQKAASLGLGLEKLKNKIAIQSATVPQEAIFKMFLELKKSEGLYVVKDNAVAYTAANNGLRRFTAVWRFPRSTAAGNYTIKATVITMRSDLPGWSMIWPQISDWYTASLPSSSRCSPAPLWVFFLKAAGGIDDLGSRNNQIHQVQRHAA